MDHSERELSDKEVSKIISEIKSARGADQIRITSKGAMYVRPIDIIVSDSCNASNERGDHFNGNGTKHCD